MKLIAVLCGAVSLIATPALAQNWQGWSGDHFDVEGSGESCMIITEFENSAPSSIKFVLMNSSEDGYLLGIFSPGWSSVEGQRYEGFSFHTGAKSYAGGVSLGHHFGSSYWKGFITEFPPEFLNQFASDRRLMVMRDRPEDPENPAILADFSLVGSGAAVVAMRRCEAWAARQRAERERRERAVADIVPDPFAPALTTPPQAEPVPVTTEETEPPRAAAHPQ